MHSAASSLSRSAASPRPIQERSIDRATSTVTTARATITVKSSTPQLPKKGAGGRINVNPFAPPTYSQLMMSVCSTTESANVAIEKKTPFKRSVRYPMPSPRSAETSPPATISTGSGASNASMRKIAVYAPRAKNAGVPKFT